jgi:hypothetical protein
VPGSKIPNGECLVVKSVRRSLFERFATRLPEPIVVERQIYCMKCKIRERCSFGSGRK